MLSGNQFGNACATLMAGILCAAALSAQPGKLLGPAQQSAMQDSNLKPALPGALAGVGIDQRLNQQLPLDVNLKDEYGRDVKLRDFFKAGKPVILAPVYYRCPMLCTQILNGVADFGSGHEFSLPALNERDPETAENHQHPHQQGNRAYRFCGSRTAGDRHLPVDRVIENNREKQHRDLESEGQISHVHKGV